jgi:nucleoside-diphosphate-sugar epimerase
MKAIVTGGAGFIGSHIVEKLLAKGAKVTVIDNLSAGKVDNIPQGAKFIEADVAYPWTWWTQELEGADVIFHNAASKKNICLTDPRKDLSVNAGGTLNLLRIAQKFGIYKFIHASTGSVYGKVRERITEKTATNPVSFYGISKLAGENYVRHFNLAYGLNTTILRYFHVYGERQEDHPEIGGVVAIFKKQIAEGKAITIHGSGAQERLFTHVEDIANANIIMMERKQETYGQTYNCVAKKTVTISALARKLGADLIEYGPPLEGDIFRFDVSAEKIGKLGVKFRNYG